nr:cbb3-type cytochrome c oxidase subunit I [Candidatus Eremiobacteraeota bacterium]
MTEVVQVASDRTARALMWTYVLSGIAIFALMALIGVAMRAEQAQWLTYGPGLFYSLMTLHGAGMITSMVLCGMGGLWYLMNRERPMNSAIAWVCYALMIFGVVLVIAGVAGGFAAGWTFLYPLPFVGATWPSWATGSFLIGVAFVMLGWAFWCTQLLGCVLRQYGGFRGAVGWDLVFHRKTFEASGKP